MNASEQVTATLTPCLRARRNRLADGFLHRVRVGEAVALDEQPFRAFETVLRPHAAPPDGRRTARQVRMVRSASGVMTADAGAGRFADEDMIADVDAQFLEFGLVEQAVAIVADAAEEGRVAAELRKGDDGVGDRAAADQPRIVAFEPLQQGSFVRPRSTSRKEPRSKPSEAKFGVGDLDEDVDEGVAEAAELKIFHGMSDPRDVPYWRPPAECSLWAPRPSHQR